MEKITKGEVEMQELDAAELKKIIGSKIKYFRKRRGISQAQLAEIVNMEMKSLSRIESGHNYPQCENLVAISRVLAVAPWQLYFRDEDVDLERMREDIIHVLKTDPKSVPVLYQCLTAFK